MNKLLLKSIPRAIGQSLAHSVKTIPYEIAGFFVVPFIYKYRNSDLEFMKKYHPKLLPWVNPEDWTNGWRGHQPGDNCVPDDLRPRFSGRWGFYRYHAMRNRAHGLRNFDWHNLQLKDGHISYVTNEEIPVYQDWWIWKNMYPKAGDCWWHVTWQEEHIGFKSIRYFKFLGKLRCWEVKLGWRIGPYDAHGPLAGSGRWKHGATPTIQFWDFGVAGEDYE